MDIRIGGTLLRIFILVYLCAPTCMEWIAKNVLNVAELVGGSSTGSEETETSEEADVRRRRNREYMQRRRAAMTLAQRRLERSTNRATANVQVATLQASAQSLEPFNRDIPSFS